MFFEVKIKSNIRELAIDYIDHCNCREYNIRVYLKTTNFEHIQRIGMVYRPYINFASVAQYEYYIVNKMSLNPGQFKIKKEMVFE